MLAFVLERPANFVDQNLVEDFPGSVLESSTGPALDIIQAELTRSPLRMHGKDFLLKNPYENGLSLLEKTKDRLEVNEIQ